MKNYNLRIVCDGAYLDTDMTVDGEKHTIIRAIVFTVDPECQDDYIRSGYRPPEDFTTWAEWQADRAEKKEARDVWEASIKTALGLTGADGDPLLSAKISHNVSEIFTAVFMKRIEA